MYVVHLNLLGLNCQQYQKIPLNVHLRIILQVVKLQNL